MFRLTYFLAPFSRIVVWRWVWILSDSSRHIFKGTNPRSEKCFLHDSETTAHTASINTYDKQIVIYPWCWPGDHIWRIWLVNWTSQMPDPSGRLYEWSSRIALAMLKQWRQCVSATSGTFSLYSTDIVQTLRTFNIGQWPMLEPDWRGKRESRDFQRSW